jgi:hypothetical protein
MIRILADPDPQHCINDIGQYWGRYFPIYPRPRWCIFRLDKGVSSDLVESTSKVRKKSFELSEDLS